MRHKFFKDLNLYKHLHSAANIKYTGCVLNSVTQRQRQGRETLSVGRLGCSQPSAPTWQTLRFTLLLDSSPSSDSWPPLSVRELEINPSCPRNQQVALVQWLHTEQLDHCWQWNFLCRSLHLAPGECQSYKMSSSKPVMPPAPRASFLCLSRGNVIGGGVVSMRQWLPQSRECWSWATGTWEFITLFPYSLVCVSYILQ